MQSSNAINHSSESLDLEKSLPKIQHAHHGYVGKNLFKFYFFWQMHIPNDPLWLICEESNIVQPACFSLWDHEQLLAHNYVVIHCYLEEGTRTDS